MRQFFSTDIFLVASPRLYRFFVVLFLIVLLSIQLATAQYYTNKRHENKNNPNYDQRKKLTYGFLIGLHTTAYQIKYSDAFVTPAFDSVYSVDPEWKQGFVLGFIVNYKVAEFLDLRITPQVAFYEHQLAYRYLRTTGQPTNEQVIETTMVELPILAKYQSIRRGNFRMYMIGGVKPGIEASGKKELDAITSRLSVREFNLALEGGVGFDFYYPLFKFSPEIRFSRGINNLLKDPNNPFGQPLSRINTNTITVYLVFQ
ncbi:PorT family protein [Chryseotalea sanaruensis]|uniref:PorT family protein n=1 Tax=Chryseotalea sanaruensis TaxID=2482724 RepID=A0A401U5F4_9BACT|nr:PorT family protein [Chryseotalea sanaruensis]